MLRRSADKPIPEGQPVAFPVFGRGRVLGALSGEGLTADAVRGVAEFLTGPCSCQVKELNPGADLLMVADWDAFLSEGGALAQPEVPNLAAVGPSLAGAGAAPGAAVASAPAVPALPGAQPAARGGIPPLLAVALAVGVGFGVIAVIAITWILRWRSLK
jgi:hypothetical protein